MDTNTEKITKKPLVSVCMITYNRALFLPKAIESVQAQSFTDWEMVIVDDASNDDTKDVVKKYSSSDNRIKYYCNDKHLKISISRNRSLSLAHGKYAAILDSDDLWVDSKKLEMQYDFLESHSEHVLVGGGVIVIDKDGNERKRYMNPLKDENIRRRIYWCNPFAHSSVMYDREKILNIGGYDTSLDTAEDYDLFLRIGTLFKFANIEKYILNYRIHDNSITVTDRLQTMILTASLVKKYKNKYPSYCTAMVRRVVRLWAYRFFVLFYKK